MSTSTTLPSISVYMPTLNSARTLEECLKSVRTQDYPADLIEIIAVDGGSTDATREICQKYDVRFIDGGFKSNMEARRSLALSEAKNEILASIDSDNILPNSNWMRQMVQPLMDDSTIVGSQTMRYGVKQGFAPFNAYCALTGVNDPVALYLGKNEKLCWLYDKWTTGKVLFENDDYVKVEFNLQNLPTMGCNGFLIYKEIQAKSQCKPEDFYHIDVVYDVVKLGYTTFAMVKNEIYHETAATLSTLSQKRSSYFIEHNPLTSNRRYLLYNPKSIKDNINLALFVFYTITLVQPVLFALHGYFKKRNLAWFLHPLVCLIFLYTYAKAVVKVFLKRFQ